jgi:hypothetical protein
MSIVLVSARSSTTTVDGPFRDSFLSPIGECVCFRFLTPIPQSANLPGISWQLFEVSQKKGGQVAMINQPLCQMSFARQNRWQFGFLSKMNISLD